MDRGAAFRVIDRFGACQDWHGDSILVFSNEVHSSKPEAGEHALVFVRQDGKVLIEAVYGRSYWVLQEHDNGWFVRVNWRNSFLIPGFDLRRQEVAFTPLEVVERVWREPRKPAGGETPEKRQVPPARP